MKLKGVVRIWVDGQPWLNGNNLVLDVAPALIAHLLGGDGDGAVVTTLGLGTSDAPAQGDDLALAEPFTKPLDGRGYPAPASIEFAWSLGLMEAAGMTIRELGLVTADGTLLARKVLPNPITKSAAMSLVGTWRIDVE